MGNQQYFVSFTLFKYLILIQIPTMRILLLLFILSTGCLNAQSFVHYQDNVYPSAQISYDANSVYLAYSFDSGVLVIDHQTDFGKNLSGTQESFLYLENGKRFELGTPNAITKEQDSHYLMYWELSKEQIQELEKFKVVLIKVYANEFHNKPIREEDKVLIKVDSFISTIYIIEKIKNNQTQLAK